MESVVVDTKVVRDLVENGLTDLGTEVVRGESEFGMRAAEDDDTVRHKPEIVDAAIGEGDALVDSEDPLSGRILFASRPVLDNDVEVVELGHDVFGELSESVIDDPLEACSIHGRQSG